MNTTKPKTKRTVRRKTDTSPLDESINQYVDSILANGQGSPQKVFSAAVRNFSKRLIEAMLQGEMQADLNGIRPTTDESPAEEEGAGNKRNGLWDEGTKNGPDRSALLGHNFVYQETKPHGFYSSYFHQRISS